MHIFLFIVMVLRHVVQMMKIINDGISCSGNAHSTYTDLFVRFQLVYAGFRTECATRIELYLPLQRL